MLLFLNHDSHFHFSLHCFFVDCVCMRSMYVYVCLFAPMSVCTRWYLNIYMLDIYVCEFVNARVSNVRTSIHLLYQYTKTVFWNIGKNTKKPSMAYILCWCIVYAWKHYTNIREKISIAFLHTQPSVQTKNRKVKLWHTITSSDWTIHLKKTIKK